MGESNVGVDMYKQHFNDTIVPYLAMKINF